MGDTSGPALNILIKLMSIMSLVLAPVFFLLYGKEVRPFLGNDTRTVEWWTGPLVGVLILVGVGIMCVVFSMINGKKMKEFKDTVEQQYEEAKNSAPTAPVSNAPTVDSPFVISTALSFKTA